MLPIFVIVAHKLSLAGKTACSALLKLFLLLILLSQLVFAVWMIIEEFGALQPSAAAIAVAAARRWWRQHWLTLADERVRVG